MHSVAAPASCDLFFKKRKHLSRNRRGAGGGAAVLSELPTCEQSVRSCRAYVCTGRAPRERGGGVSPVAMATSNKQCQTRCDVAMFDESVTAEGQEVDSSASSGDGPLRAAITNFRPPARHFSSGSDSDSASARDQVSARHTFTDVYRRCIKLPAANAKARAGGGVLFASTALAGRHESLGKGVLSAEKQEEARPAGGRTARRRSSTSESDSEDAEKRELVVGSGGAGDRRRAPPLPADGAYDPRQFQELKVPPDMENLFQYIMKYAPQKIELEARLRAFVPECAPAVGDCDALLKLSTPAAAPRARALPEPWLEHIDNLGLTLLDEPAAEQSEPALLHLQLRAISKSAGGKTTLTRKISEAEKNPKAIERWIKDVGELHAAAPPRAPPRAGKMPDIDSLMEEWPEAVEAALDEVGFPPHALQCSLAQYAELVCALLDVPVLGRELPPRLHALHQLFVLYSAVNHSQLYAERQRGLQ
ncbi:intraflagellar transport protein 46 homolog [Battus philenor]|uniref:intraflagellar transport protein 46 homolog n=1 Tax=Battus philenor TaxID=42288 RepID=UPI0035CE9CCA